MNELLDELSDEEMESFEKACDLFADAQKADGEVSERLRLEATSIMRNLFDGGE